MSQRADKCKGVGCYRLLYHTFSLDWMKVKFLSNATKLDIEEMSKHSFLPFKNL